MQACVKAQELMSWILPSFLCFIFNIIFLKLIVACRLCVIYVRELIPMCRLWLHGLYWLYGPHCPLSPERPLNLITHSWHGYIFSITGHLSSVQSFDAFFIVSPHYFWTISWVASEMSHSILAIKWYQNNGIQEQMLVLTLLILQTKYSGFEGQYHAC